MNLQAALIQIIRQAEGLKLPYLLIGGHAVVLYGIARLTRDVDLVIPDQHVEVWREFLIKTFHYRVCHSTHAYLQFDTDSSQFPPVDMMLVDGATWEKLLAKAQSVQLVPEVEARLPHPSHLIAMKLTAFSSARRRWDNEDWSDIVKLIHKQKLSLEDPEFRAIVLKYGSEEILQKLKKTLL